MANIQNIFLILLALNIAAIMIPIGMDLQNGNSLFVWVLNPTSAGFATIGFWGWIQAAIGVAGAGAIILGAFIKNDTMIYGAIAIEFILFAVAPASSLFVLLEQSFGRVVAMLVVGPGLIYYIMSVITWLRTGR
jgi:hypothetical protein